MPPRGTIVEAKDFAQAVTKMSHYTTGPETGLWTTVLQVYVAWEAAVAGVPLQAAAEMRSQTGDDALLHAVQTFGKGA